MVDKVESVKLPSLYKHLVAITGANDQAIKAVLLEQKKLLEGYNALVLGVDYDRKYFSLLTGESRKDACLCALANAFDSVRYFGNHIFNNMSKNRLLLTFDYYCHQGYALIKSGVGKSGEKVISNLPAPGLIISLSEIDENKFKHLPEGSTVITVAENECRSERIINLLRKHEMLK